MTEKGTIKKKVEGKNFGFISRDGEEKDVFFHASVLEGVSFEDLHEGDAVEFEMEDDAKGPKATKVVLAAKE